MRSLCDRPSRTFPKAARLLTQVEYRAVSQGGKRRMGSMIAISYRTGSGDLPRLGITVSKRYGKAHDRNRFKRVVREAFRLLSPRLPRALELHVSPARSKEKIDRESVLHDLVNVLGLHGLSLP